MSRNPHATNLRHFRHQRIEDKRRQLRRKFGEEAAEGLIDAEDIEFCVNEVLRIMDQDA